MKPVCKWFAPATFFLLALRAIPSAGDDGPIPSGKSTSHPNPPTNSDTPAKPRHPVNPNTPENLGPPGATIGMKERAPWGGRRFGYWGGYPYYGWGDGSGDYAASVSGHGSGRGYGRSYGYGYPYYGWGGYPGFWGAPYGYTGPTGPADRPAMSGDKK